MAFVSNQVVERIASILDTTIKDQRITDIKVLLERWISKISDESYNRGHQEGFNEGYDLAIDEMEDYYDDIHQYF